MDSEISTVKRFFESHNMRLSNVWLESCIQWCKEESLQPGYTVRDLQSQVYEQWLLLDLRDVDLAVLPPNLSSHKHHVLNGDFALQVMQVVDISKPKLWQLQKIRNSNVLTSSIQKDADLAGTGKRMLQLTLTDGVQEVEAMEFHPIPILNVNMKAGCKLRLTGPVTIRRGRIMLESSNVKLLGGEVDELLVPNAAENVLAKILKLSLNPNPLFIEDKILTTEENDTTEGYSRIQSFVRNEQATNVNNKRPLSSAATMTVDDEEMRIEDEVNMLLEAEEALLGRTTKKSKLNSDMFDDISFNPEDFEHMDRVISSTQACSNTYRTTSTVPVESLQKDKTSCAKNPSSSSKPNDNLSKSLDMDDDIFDDINIDAHLDEIDKSVQMQNSPLKIAVTRVTTISKLLQNKDNISRGIFKIKAKFKSVVEKLTMGDDEYKLVMKIEDNTGEITVRLHSDVISDFAGYCPSAILSLRSNIVEQDSAAVETVMNALREVRNKLLQLDNVMEVQIVQNEEYPTVVKIL